MTTRRSFVTLLGGAAAAWPLPARAQQPERMRRIGVLNTVADTQPRFVHFQRGLNDLGYSEGRDIVFDRRSAMGQYDRLSGLATELVALKVDVLFAATLRAAFAAQRATSTIPIVFVLVPDPVGSKLVSSIARPGGNITGIATGFEYTTAKRFEIFKEALGFARVALLVNPTEPIVTRRTVEESEIAATTHKASIHLFEARIPEDIERAFSEIARAGINAVFVAVDAMFWQARKQIAGLAAQYRIASSFGLREHVEAGGLMSYGPSYDAPFYRAAAFVDKILKGEKPGDLPVEQPTKFEFLINLRTANALGLNLPPMLLARADEAIE